jgi:hypothetical protein
MFAKDKLFDSRILRSNICDMSANICLTILCELGLSNTKVNVSTWCFHKYQTTIFPAFSRQYSGVTRMFWGMPRMARWLTLYADPTSNNDNELTDSSQAA